MKILILTQKVDINDDVLGFMHGWINEFAKNCELVTVVCLQKGEYNLPQNVNILSLGKEDGKNKLKYVFNFYKYSWRERKKYDIVFAHMNYEYVNFGGIFWRLSAKKIYLWYAHGYAPLGLKIAEKFVDNIFTSTKSGCRINSKKIEVIGQGVDVEIYKTNDLKLKIKDRNKIISIGRISPSKDYLTLIKAAEILNNKGINLSVEIIGGPAVDTDLKYFNFLKQLVADKKLKEKIKFVGPVANKEILKYLLSSGLFVNMSLTGSLDKAMVEAMATELPVVTCNESMLEVLENFQEALIYPKNDFVKLADRIEYIINLTSDEYSELGKGLRNIVVKKHSLNNFVKKILSYK